MNDTISETQYVVPIKETQPDSRPHKKEHDKTDHKVQSIDEMLELFRKGIPVVFLGGQMGTLDEDGNRLPVTDRFGLQQFCEDNDIYYYDPVYGQPNDPSFFVSRQTDKTGLLLSLVDVLTIGKESMGSVSVFEAIFDTYLGRYPHLGAKRIICFPDASSLEDVRFAPPDLEYVESGDIDFEHSKPEHLQRHFQTALRTGNLLRSELLQFAHESKRIVENGSRLKGLTIADTKEQYLQLKEDPENSCYEITNSNLHIEDMTEAFADIFDDKRVVIFFHPPVNQKNAPIMNTLHFENPADKQKILDQYIHEGNSIRNIMIKKLLRNPKTTEFTFNIEDTKQALLRFYQELKENIKRKKEKEKEEEDLRDSMNPNPSWMAQ